MAETVHEVAEKSKCDEESQNVVNHSREQYDENGVASSYIVYSSGTVPLSTLEHQLVDIALDEIGVQGFHVLDLGGGNGVHARTILEKGAATIDLIDISTDMLKIAESEEAKLGRTGKMRTFVSDATKDLSGLGLRPQYDMVMVGWVFDHSHSDDDLDGFWRNIVTFLRPGGAVVCVRVANVEASSATTRAHYGVQFRDIRPIPGGSEYQVHILIPDSNFDFGGTTMKRSTGRVPAMYAEHDFVDLKAVPFEATAAVKEDLDFWKPFLDDPFFYCEYARKKKE